MRAYGWPCLVGAGAALLILGVAAQVLERRLADDAAALAYIRGEAANVGRGVEDLRHLRESITSAQTCQMVSSSFHAKRVLPMLILGELARVRPDGMRFTVVDQHDGTVDLKGEASSALAISELAKRIDGSAVLERPSQLPAAASQAGNSPGYPLAFEIAMRVRSRQQ
jgi:Tfp pilus assembly protein PilN